MPETFNKAEAHPWFLDAVKELGLGSCSRARAWDAAWTALEDQGALPERWKGWVRQIVQRALSRAHTDPGGLFFTLLQDPPDGLDKKLPAVTSRHEWMEREQEERRRRWAEERAEHLSRYGDARPLPLGALVHARQAGMDVRELLAAWEEEGRPDPHEFTFGDWQHVWAKWEEGAPFRARRHA